MQYKSEPTDDQLDFVDEDMAPRILRHCVYIYMPHTDQ